MPAMETGPDMPICPPPWSEPSDLGPLLVVMVGFLVAGWLLRRWRKKRKDRRAEK